MRTFFLSLAALVFFACGSPAPSEPPTPEPPEADLPPPRVIRVLVLPFEDRNAHDETAYASLGLAVFATARLEELSRTLDPSKGLKLEAVVGPHTYPAEAARLRADRRARIEPDAVLAEAKRVGATHVLTGATSGRVEKWTLGVELYEVGPDALARVGAAEETRKIFAWAKEAPDPRYPGHQMAWIHAMFGAQTSAAFAQAGIVLPDEAVRALSTPQSPSAVPFIRLSEAYRALLLGEGEAAMELALDKSELAVRGWPDYQIGLRLYAWLLWQRGRTVAARQQFGEALKRDPKDVRALVALGRLEIAEGQYDAARTALQAAVALRPDDAVVHFWLGETHAKLGDVAEAIARYERSRQLDPANLDTHRALAGLYAGQKRYADAASALEIVVAGEPDNLDAVFLLAACHRAAGKEDKAIETYALAIARFGAEARLHKFSGDLLAKAGQADAAARAYAEAKTLAPKDARWRDPELVYGEALIARVRAAEADRAEMERLRGEFQTAVNDGIWDLAWNRKEACAPGRSGAAYLLARATSSDYAAHGTDMQRNVGKIRASLKNGEGAALTPDELRLAEDLLRYEGIALRDLREMRTGYGALRALAARQGCSLDPSEAGTVTIAEIRSRDAKRKVDLPAPPKRDASGISPVVPDGSWRVISFWVDNRSGGERVLVLDGKKMEPPIPAGEKRKFSARYGEHVFCLLPSWAIEDCGAASAARSDLLHENWTLVAN